MLLLIIKTFQEQKNGIHFAYNEGVEFLGKFVKLGGGGGGGWDHNKMKWGLKFSKNCKVAQQRVSQFFTFTFHSNFIVHE